MRGIVVINPGNPTGCVLTHDEMRMIVDVAKEHDLFVIGDEVKRYSDLQKQIPGISKKMLTQTLRNLEAAGLVDRKVYAVVPPKTEYRLTPLGLSLLVPVRALAEWAKAHQAELDAMGEHTSEDFGT